MYSTVSSSLLRAMVEICSGVKAGSGSVWLEGEL